MTKLLVKSVRHKLSKLFSRVTKRDTQLEHFNGLNEPTSQHLNTKISIFTLQEIHRLSQPKKCHKCHLCHQVFASFCSLRLHKQKMHNAQSELETKNLDSTQLVGEIEDEALKEELETCNHFLVHSQLENGRHRVSICPWTYWLHTLETETRHKRRRFCLVTLRRSYRV